MHKQDGFSAGLVLSPVCGLDSWDLDKDSYRHGKRRQCRLWRMSTDIKVVIPWVAFMQVEFATEWTSCLLRDRVYELSEHERVWGVVAGKIAFGIGAMLDYGAALRLLGNAQI